jgi:hypothetical protein
MPQRVGCVVTAALTRQQCLEMFLKAEFHQTRAALVEMAPQQLAALVVALVVQKQP